jgi:MFS family permease
VSDASLAALFRTRAFMRSCYARVAATAANQMLMVAVGWQMYDLTGSAWDLGLVGLFQFLPALALVLLAGHAVDRFPRALILALCMAGQALIATLLAALSLNDAAGRELLLGVALGLGTIKAFQLPAQQALVPQLVADALLPRALAFSSATMQGAIIAGPALGGFVYLAGAAAVQLSCAALFCVAGLLLATLKPPAARRGATPLRLQSLLAGVRFVRERPVLLGALSLDMFAVLLGGATALLPMFARDILFVGPWGLGLLRAAPAVGALAASFALAHWPVTRRAGVVMLCAVAVYGFAMLAFAWSSAFVLSLAALAVSGGADMVSVVVRQSLVQLDTPDAMRGRVSAVNSVFIGASNQLGEFESGATAAWLGPVGSVLLGGAGTVLVALAWVRLFPDLASRDRLSEPGPRHDGLRPASPDGP